MIPKVENNAAMPVNCPLHTNLICFGLCRAYFSMEYQKWLKSQGNQEKGKNSQIFVPHCLIEQGKNKVA